MVSLSQSRSLHIFFLSVKKTHCLNDKPVSQDGSWMFFHLFAFLCSSILAFLDTHSAYGFNYAYLLFKKEFDFSILSLLFLFVLPDDNMAGVNMFL